MQGRQSIEPKRSKIRRTFRCGCTFSTTRSTSTTKCSTRNYPTTRKGFWNSKRSRFRMSWRSLRRGGSLSNSSWEGARARGSCQILAFPSPLDRLQETTNVTVHELVHLIRQRPRCSQIRNSSLRPFLISYTGRAWRRHRLNQLAFSTMVFAVEAPKDS